MKYLIILFVITLIIFIAKYSKYKHLNDMSIRLNLEFNNWIKDPDNNLRPNNAEFSMLFKERYNQDSMIKTTVRGNRAVLVKEPADVVASFPTTHHQLLIDQLFVLDNLEDYFKMQYNQLFTFQYWVDVVIFMPKHILEYVGVDGASKKSRLLTVLYWIFSIIWTPFENLITQWIQSLL